MRPCCGIHARGGNAMGSRRPRLKAALIQYGAPFYLCLATIVLMVALFVLWAPSH